jgi:hypothetical protein
MRLLPEEQKIREFGSLTLTTHRLRQYGGYTVKRQRRREVTSIRLEHITHCQITSVDRPAFFFLGLTLIVIGTIAGSNARPHFLGLFGFILGAIGVMLIISYFTNRHSEIDIATPTISIKEHLSKTSLDEAMGFVQTVEHAAIELSYPVAAADPPPAPVRVPPMAEVEYWGG